MFKNKPELLIFTLLAIVTVVWGLNVIMIKYLASIFPVIQLAAWRIGLAAICLLIFTYKYWRPVISTVELKTWMYISLIGLTSIFAHQILIAQGLQLTSGSVGSLILALNPLTTALLAMMFLGETFEWKRFIGIGLGFFGVLIVVGQPTTQGLSSITGDFIMFLSMLAYVAGGLFIKKAIEHVDVITVTTFSHVIGAAFLFVTWLFIPGEQTVYQAPGFAYLVMLFSGSVATALCTTWWNMGIKVIGPSRTTMFLNVMPLSSLIFAAIFLREQLHWVHALALTFIVIGIYLGCMKKIAKPITSQQMVVKS